MKNVEFCYWLQGYFELSPPGGLSSKQVITIRNHLNLVRKVEKKLGEFTSWLEGYLEGRENEELPQDTVDKVRAKLSDIFRHEIDPSYGVPGEGLGVIHSGGHSKPSSHDVLIRC